MTLRSPLPVQRRFWRRSRWISLALVSCLLCMAAAFSTPSDDGKDPAIALLSPWATAPAIAQAPNLNIADTARVLYEQLPFMPLENQYLNQDGEEVPESSLITRMLLYHTAVQRRQPLFRLDWKLTLADYLDANETIMASTYPNSSTLQENPMEGDKAAIRGLTRQQREQFVDTIVLLLNPLAAREATTPSTPAAPAPGSVPPEPALRPGTGSTTPLPQEPRPGDAQLLLP